MEKVQRFFGIWLIVLVANQVVIFHGCFKIHCLLMALPHTGFIAFVIGILLRQMQAKTQNDKKYEEYALDQENGNSRQKDTPKQNLSSAQDYFEKLKKMDEKELREKYNSGSKPKVTPKPKTSEEVSLVKLKKMSEEAYKANQERTLKPKLDPLKEKGDRYERFIGEKFEEKGDLVIYNGFINGYADKGVDLISISLNIKSIDLIQCKNWTKKPLLLADVENIYSKLKAFDIINIPKDANIIKKHLRSKKLVSIIRNILKVSQDDYTIRYTLYISSDKIIDLNIGKEVKLISNSIFRYQDMKIVIKSD